MRTASHDTVRPQICSNQNTRVERGLGRSRRCDVLAPIEEAVEAADGENDGDIEEERQPLGEEERQPLRKAPEPWVPTQLEIEEHRISHYPFRSWCIHCLMGRGVGEHHGANAGRESSIPQVCIDIFYITEKGYVCKRNELKELGGDGEDNGTKLLDLRRAGQLVKGIVMKCKQTKAVFAFLIPL